MAPRASLAAALAAVVVAACATPIPVSVPAALEPPADQVLMMELAAAGAQVYECRPKAGEVAAYEWAFVAPDAVLYDASGHKVGTHGAGPHWTALDGSRIDGTVKARADAQARAAIPWLLLTTHSDGSPGTFAGVTSVQRVETAAGTPPLVACGTTNVGAAARVPYTATYRLFGAGEDVRHSAR
jgi:hypothetical protein